jgi:hypothetical protein
MAGRKRFNKPLCSIAWDGAPLQDKLHREMVKRLRVASEKLRRRVVVKVGVSGWGFSASGKMAGHRVSKARVMPANKKRDLGVRSVGYWPSRPGEPPHADTGLLKRSIFYTVHASYLNAIIGTNLKYGVPLEIGSDRMAARPYLRPALAEAQGELRAILTKKLPGG